MFFTGRKMGWAVVLGVALLAGCTTSSVTRAPVEDRGVDGALIGVPEALPGAENAGRPGYYTVRPGDTIFRIATEFNQPWRDIVSWNQLDDANVIEVGQVLRVIPPTPMASVPVATADAGKAAGTPAPAAAPASARPAPTPTPPPSAGADNVQFIWPAQGEIVARFNEETNKGLGIAGKAGDPVLSAADGRVVYSGAGLRGYGNLVIVKHNDTFLTAYAHNQKLLVKEDQSVKKGQKIAEMGNTDADRVKLHFEIRRSGKPVDPARYLPAR